NSATEKEQTGYQSRRQFLQELGVGSSMLLASMTFSGCGAKQAQTMSIDDANSFTIQEHNFSYGTDSSVSTDEYRLGKIEENNWGLNVGFTYSNSDGTKIATAKQRNLSWGTTIDIYDGNGDKIGQVTEKWIENKISSITNLLEKKRFYEVTDASGTVIGSSKKVQLFGNEITISNPDGEELVKFSKSALDMGADTWQATFSGEIDRRLVIFIPNFQSRADNQKD
ncbi:MAG: hypothetical protein KDD62_06890, partial [Bdellovibrionales bacterium]|nr:hypothetical protein [Bdellovibrionales bacterium]